MSAPEPALQERLLREQVAALWATTASATLSDLTFSWIVALLFWWHNDDPLALVWLAIRMLRMLRYRGQRAFHTDPQVHERSRFWARKHVREIVLFSSTWGLAPWFMLPASDRSMTAVMVLVILGVCSTGLSAVTPRWPSVLAFALPMVLGLSGALLWQGDAVGTVLALCCLVYLAVTLSVARTQHRLLTQTLLSRFEKEALAAQLQEQVRLTELASQEKTRFLASASHDLRQPLHAIGLFGASLERTLRGQPGHPTALHLQQAVQAMQASLGAMLDISRLDAGVVAAERRPLPLQPLLLSLHHSLLQRAQDKGIELRIRASDLTVQSDPVMLERLLGNLVENAVKYTHRGGVLVAARARGARVRIDIVDTGIGIASADLGRVFDEFYQVDNPGRDRSRGLGIGLSIVRRLSQLLDHPVRVRSRPGRGTRFQVELPAATQPADPAPSAKPIPLPGALPARVLLLDDEVAIGHALQALLQAHGVELTAVADAQTAGQALAEGERDGRPYAVLVCDLRLADGADGLQIAHALQARHTPPPALLLVTGETAPQVLQRVHDAGVPVLFKPVDPGTLLDALVRLNGH